MFVRATSSPSLWKVLVCCGSGSHALKALSCGIMRQAPICHLCLCPHFVQCVPWTWASPSCMSFHMTKQSPDLFLSQPFMAESLCLPPISKHHFYAPVHGSFRWAFVSFLSSAELYLIPLSHILDLGMFLIFNQQVLGASPFIQFQNSITWDIFSRRKDGEVSCEVKGGQKEINVLWEPNMLQALY